jgi:hypothetical protein
MSPSAQVHSIDLLQRLHAALARFGVDAQTALGAASAEVRRVHDTLADRLKYWQQQVNKRQEELGQARAALSHARALHRGESIGCVEQELALRKAQERLREAEGKVAVTRRWQRELPELIKDFEGPARGLSGFIEADLRQALALLESKIAALEAYLAAAEHQAPAAAPPAPAETSSEPEAGKPT